MRKSNMTFIVDSNVVGWGLASVHTRALTSSKNNPTKRKSYRTAGLMDVTPSITRFMSKHREYIESGKIVHSDGSNFFGGIAPLSPISNKPEFKTKVESILRYEYGFSDDEIARADGFITDLAALGSEEDIQGIARDTSQYKDSIEKVWCANEDQIVDYVVGVLGYRPESIGKVCTYVVYPNFDTQRTSQISKDRTLFFFGKRGETDPNRILSYMSYQAIKQPMLPYSANMTKKDKDAFDSFVRFLTEKDVYNQLTGRSYLDITSKGENVGAMAQIYPFWLGYRYRNSDINGSDSIQDIMKAIKRDKAYFDSLPQGSKKRKAYSAFNFEKLDPIKISKLYKEKRGITPYEFIKTDFSRTDLVYKEKYVEQAR